MILFTLHLKVFQSPKAKRGAAVKGDTAQKAAESILKYFRGFDAFELPHPSPDKKVTQNLNSAKDGINEEFVKGVEAFSKTLKHRLVPKRSFKDGEFVTGEGIFMLEVGKVLFC